MNKFCKKCQTETDRYSGGGCKPCARARTAKWQALNTEKMRKYNAQYRTDNLERLLNSAAKYRDENTEKISARNAKYRSANIEKTRRHNAKYRAENIEQVRKYSTQYYINNINKLREYKANYYKVNAEKLRERQSVWRVANPEKIRIQGQNRRASKLIQGVKLSQGLSAKLFILQKGKCPCCKQPLGDDFHLDHIIPLALGGSNTDENIQLLRARCNNQKYAKHPIDFMRQRGFLL